MSGIEGLGQGDNSDGVMRNKERTLSRWTGSVRWAISRLIDEVEREEVGCKLTANFDTRIKKYCAIDKWAMY